MKANAYRMLKMRMLELEALVIQIQIMHPRFITKILAWIPLSGARWEQGHTLATKIHDKFKNKKCEMEIISL